MPSMSPRTQAMSQYGMPSDQAKALFDQGFTQAAYGTLINKLPNVSPDVVTFKILESDPDAGSGVGAFVLMRNNQAVYIPVVMAESQLKPLDILFFKELNAFLPLTKEWLAKVDKLSVDELGQSVNAPETLSTDVDIRNTVVPPTTGRYSYASLIEDADVVFSAARETTEPPKLAFLEFLAKAPNRVKVATARLFETRPKLLKQAVYFYGKDPLTSALATHAEKVADYGAKMSPTGALYIADEKTGPGEFKSIFGAKAPMAFSGVALKGYFAKDDRKDLKRALKEQHFTQLQEPKDAGAYKFWLTDGTSVTALVVGNPVNLFREAEGKRVPARNIRFVAQHAAPANPLRGAGTTYRVPGSEGVRNEVHVDRYVGVTEDGKLLQANNLIGEPVSLDELEGSAVYRKTVGDGAAAGPRTGQTGIFVQRRGHTFTATTPIRVESITTDSNGVKRIVVSAGWERRTLVTDPKSPLSKLMVPATGTLVYIPADYVFIPTKGEISPGDVLSSPKDISHWMAEGLIRNGAEKIAVYKPGGRGFVIGHGAARQELDFVPALRKLATEAHISVEDAEFALKQADEAGRYHFWTLTDGQYTKLAAEAEGDPAQQAMDQVQMAQMGPQPQGPSPVDMAVAEQIQNLQAQAQALSQMQQLLMTVQQRANVIAGGGGAAGDPAAAAAAMGGPMDPAMMGVGAPVGGQQMQPGMDPGTQEEMTPAMMNSDDGSIESLVQQVNPQYMEQAGGLQDAGIFDAAALSSMAQAPALKDLVGAYLPNLEKALDNVGRILLTLWMDETGIKEQIGDEAFVDVEDNLRATLKGLGDTVLKIDQHMLVLPHQNGEFAFEGH